MTIFSNRAGVNRLRRCGGNELELSGSRQPLSQFHSMEYGRHPTSNLNSLPDDNSGGGIDSFHLYNNLFDGPMGSGGWTAWVYLEANGPGSNWVTATGTLPCF